ncbi:MAG: ribosome hibernation-promoting factor, HPF/YfiA family [Dermatophilaceae bacterium]|nr:ribosome-associated translation inhibitor RaiA [Intrasporangiaceae bacterium]
MDIVVTSRQTTLADQFRSHAEEKVSKAASLAPKTQRIEVMVSREPNRRQAKDAERVEITCHGKGPVIRAEASAEDRYAALDLAMDKLIERLRRRNDRRHVHRGHRTPESVAHATSRFDATTLQQELTDSDADTAGDTGLDSRFGDSPIEVREKVHASAPMTLEQALHELELVGHDFYLFHDSESDRPSVVYRRRGWSYGVLHLDVTAEGENDSDDAWSAESAETVGAAAS